MTDTTQQQNLQDAIARFRNAVGRADDFTKGNADLDVVGTEGTYPSLAKLTVEATTKLKLLQAIPIVNTSNFDMTLGMAVYAPGVGEGGLAIASSDARKNVIGLVANDLILSQSGRGSVLSTGVLTGSVAQWEAATGLAGGLIPNANYYLDIVAGHITPYPSGDPGHFLCPIGQALTTTDFLIRIERQIAL
jgi:hypothetical protein